MTIVLLASISLFALVVTSRPILPDSDLSVQASSVLQTAVQATFQIHSGKNDLKADGASIQFSDPEQLLEFFELDNETIEAIASLELVPEEKPSVEETPVSDSLEDENTFDGDDEHTELGGEHDTDQPTSTEEPIPQQVEPLPEETPSAPLVVLAFSCIAAVLALACIVLTLCIAKALRSQMLASQRAWELLPRFWKRSKVSVPQEDTVARAKKPLPVGGSLLLQTDVQQQRLLAAEEGSASKSDLHAEEKPLYFDAVSDMDSDWDDVDEKYQDAIDLTPLPVSHDLPPDDNVHPRQSRFDDPPLPTLQYSTLDQPGAGDRSSPLMGELCASPISRPAWSVRAIDSPLLGISSREPGADPTPQPLIHPRRRAYRSAVPEFDIALAMQLRPGLGIGADPAWMVRFLMAIFGWFTVALTSNRQTTSGATVVDRLPTQARSTVGRSCLVNAVSERYHLCTSEIPWIK